MNTATSTRSESLFVNALLCTTVQYNEKLDAISRTILNNTQLKKRQNGETKQLAEFKTEKERIEAIEEVFGIKLSKEEREGIKGDKVAIDQYELQTTFGAQ
jgi:arylamine N-acetyltransferase